jgi:hypothetical protein
VEVFMAEEPAEPKARETEMLVSKARETEMLVSELASDHQGSLSPFGDVTFPLPVTRLRYQHPSPADRPHLPGDSAAGR